MNKKYQKKTNNKANIIKIAVAIASVLVMLVVAFTYYNGNKTTGDSTQDTTGVKDTTQDTTGAEIATQDSTTQDTTGAEVATKDTTGKEETADTTGTLSVVKDNDIVIPVSSISETATFYPAEIDGTKLEVLAVKAPDGTIRTAFNTCQVCYSSGKGYYVQEGDNLVCQNCGNRFGMGDVEVTRGGCNPVPIDEENKTVDSDNITISKDFLTEAAVIFKNWKN